MKVRVVSEFRDINNFSFIHRVGEEKEFDDHRAANLIMRGLVEAVAPTATVEDAETEEETKEVVETEEVQADEKREETEAPVETVETETEAPVEEVKEIKRRGRRSKAEVEE